MSDKPNPTKLIVMTVIGVIVVVGVWVLIGAFRDDGNVNTYNPREPNMVRPPVTTITLNYANFPPAPSFPCVQMEKWKEVVEERTHGVVKVNTHPGGSLLKAKAIFDGVASGAADIGCMAMSYHPGKFPVSEAVDLPHGFTSARAATLTLYDLIMKRKPEEFEKVKILTLFTCPPARLMTIEPVRTLNDMKGMQLRCSGTGVDVIKRLGGAPVGMPMSETSEALRKGTVKGIVSSLEILKDFKFATTCPYSTKTNLHVVTFAVIMNRNTWDGLPEDVQKVMDDLGREHAIWTAEYVDGHEDEAVAWSKAEHNHEQFILPPADAAQAQNLLNPMIDEYVARMSEKGVDGTGIVADVRELKDKYEKQSGSSAP